MLVQSGADWICFSFSSLLQTFRYGTAVRLKNFYGHLHKYRINKINYGILKKKFIYENIQYATALRRKGQNAA